MFKQLSVSSELGLPDIIEGVVVHILKELYCVCPDAQPEVCLFGSRVADGSGSRVADGSGSDWDLIVGKVPIANLIFVEQLTTYIPRIGLHWVFPTLKLDVTFSKQDINKLKPLIFSEFRNALVSRITVSSPPDSYETLCSEFEKMGNGEVATSGRHTQLSIESCIPGLRPVDIGAIGRFFDCIGGSFHPAPDTTILASFRWIEAFALRGFFPLTAGMRAQIACEVLQDLTQLPPELFAQKMAAISNRRGILTRGDGASRKYVLFMLDMAFLGSDQDTCKVTCYAGLDALLLAFGIPEPEHEGLIQKAGLEYRKVDFHKRNLILLGLLLNHAGGLSSEALRYLVGEFIRDSPNFLGFSEGVPEAYQGAETILGCLVVLAYLGKVAPVCALITQTQQCFQLADPGAQILLKIFPPDCDVTPLVAFLTHPLGEVVERLSMRDRLEKMEADGVSDYSEVVDELLKNAVVDDELLKNQAVKDLKSVRDSVSFTRIKDTKVLAKFIEFLDSLEPARRRLPSSDSDSDEEQTDKSVRRVRISGDDPRIVEIPGRFQLQRPDDVETRPPTADGPSPRPITRILRRDEPNTPSLPHTIVRK